MSVQLTSNEITALKTCLNYESLEGQLSDNYSNGGHDEFKKALGWNNQQVAALIGSLESKGLGWGDDNEGNGHIFWLSEKGVRAIFAVIDAERENENLRAIARHVGCSVADAKLLSDALGLYFSR